MIILVWALVVLVCVSGNVFVLSANSALYTGPVPTTALSLPLDCTTGCVVGLVVGGMVVMVTVMVLFIILGVVWKRRKSTQRHSRSSRHRRGLQTPSDEEPPFGVRAVSEASPRPVQDVPLTEALLSGD